MVCPVFVTLHEDLLQIWQRYTPVNSVFHFAEQLVLEALSVEEYEKLFLFRPHRK
jgi:hypothetical protein